MEAMTIDPGTRRRILAGLCMLFFVACIEGTVMSICGKQIMSDLDGMQYYSWLIAAYLLTSTVMIPIAGKVSDQIGRRPVIYAGAALFVLGSVLAAASSVPAMLIASRAVQGVGGGMITPVSNALIADVYAPEDRPKVMAGVNLLCTLGMVAGPFVGGAICALLTWHWVFLINIPLVALFFALTFGKLPAVPSGGDHRIDYAGMCALSALVLVVLLVFQFYQSFGTVLLVAAATVSVALLIMFIRIERRAAEPVMSPRLLRRRAVRMSSAFLFVYNLGITGLTSFIAVFAIYVYGLTEMECALICIPLFLTMGLFTVLNGILLPKTGYRLWVTAGFLMMGIPLIVLYLLGSSAPIPVLLVVLAVFGAGSGALGSTVSVSLQNHTPPEEMGMSLGTVSLVRSVGATLGAAAFASVVSVLMDSEMASSPYAGAAEAAGVSGTGLLDLATDAYEALYPGIIEAVSGFFGHAFVACTAIIGASFLALALLGLRMDSGYTVYDPDSDQRRRISRTSHSAH